VIKMCQTKLDMMQICRMTMRHQQERLRLFSFDVNNVSCGGQTDWLWRTDGLIVADRRIDCGGQTDWLWRTDGLVVVLNEEEDCRLLPSLSSTILV
jgi:hypothetical protein